MFSGIGSAGRFIVKTVVIIIIMAVIIGWHPVFAAIGDLIHHVSTGVHTATNHAKHGS